MLPSHLRPGKDDDGAIDWEPLLQSRIAGAPGYVGTHLVKTRSMAGDMWDVHWASNGREAAAAIEPLFRADLTHLRTAYRAARAIARQRQILLDKILEKGKVVFSRSWDDEGFLANGVDVVKMWKRKYAVEVCGEHHGPLKNVEKAIEQTGLWEVGSGPHQFDCELMSSEEIGSRLCFTYTDEDVERFNGADWLFKGWIRR